MSALSVVAATLLVTAGDNPQRIANQAAFAGLCGVSPVEASPATTTGSPTTPPDKHRNIKQKRESTVEEARDISVRARFETV